MNIYLRNLEVNDALISYRWRNNHRIWKYTGSKPDKYISLETETEWIKNALQRKDEKRYAICKMEDDEYIGNVQLTNIINGEAELHLFIGEEKYWGKNIGTIATKKIIQIGFNEIFLNKIYLFVQKENLAAINVYRKNGFQIEKDFADQFKMVIRNDR